MWSFKATWDEGETEIWWKNTEGKDCFCLKRLAENSKQFLYGFSFTLCPCMSEASSQCLSLLESHHFRGGKTGSKYLAQQDMVSWAFGKERRPWASQDPHCCHSCCSHSGEWVLGYPSVPRDPQRGLALSPFLCY